MKQKVFAFLAAAALMSGVGVATATVAHADTIFGPYTTYTTCINMQAAYERGGWRIVSPCNIYRVNQSNTFVWKFRAI